MFISNIMEHYANLCSSYIKYFIDYVKKVPGFDFNSRYRYYYDDDSSNA